MIFAVGVDSGFVVGEFGCPRRDLAEAVRRLPFEWLDDVRRCILGRRR